MNLRLSTFLQEFSPLSIHELYKLNYFSIQYTRIIQIIQVTNLQSTVRNYLEIWFPLFCLCN
jgi:hypothetical protein